MRPGDPGYYTAGRKVVIEWPDTDPPPELLSTSSRPLSAPVEPETVQALTRVGIAHGWAALVGYSLGKARAVRKGTYKRMETFGVWAGPHPGSGWRWCAMHDRSPDLKGGWSWSRTAIWHQDGRQLAPGLGVRFVDGNITDLREWLSVSGNLPPSWFIGVHARVAQQAEDAKKRAKERPAAKKPKEGAS